MDEQLKNSILKTGTSLVGIVCKDGIVLAGDRKVTAGGNLVMRKDEPKVDQINEYLLIAGTGHSSDIDFLKKIIRAELKLKELKTKQRPSVKEGANLIGMVSFKNIRTPSMIPSIAGTLVAGYNEDGSTELYTIEPAGSVVKVSDYDANFSSGMPFILGLLERQYSKDLAVKEGIKLAVDCIKSSSQRDTASGHGVDVFTITKEGIKQVVKQEVESVYKDQK
ncbi:MAG: proteasome subunit beta [archaeon]